jgi:hypothetical protein
MQTVYFTRAWGVYNAHEQATLTDVDAAPLLTHGIAVPAATVRQAHRPRQGEPPQPAHRTIRSNASRAEIDAWLKG